MKQVNLPEHPPKKGVRGFGLDIHLTFASILPREQVLQMLRTLPSLTAELYARIDDPDHVPSARLTGPSVPSEELQAVLHGWLESGMVRVVEVGLRGFLKSAEGYTEWMPWRRNVIVSRTEVEKVALHEGEKYVLE